MKTKTKTETKAGEPARGALCAPSVGRFTRFVFVFVFVFIFVSIYSSSANWLITGLDIQTARQNFKRPKNREDSSDLDENLGESIAAMKTFISKYFVAAGLQTNCFKKFRLASCCLNIYR